MTWQPKRQVIDLSPVIDNLFGYFQANESDTFTWANKGISGIPPMKKYYNSLIGRVYTVFPYFALSRQDLVERSDDNIEAVFSLTFEGVIQGADAVQLVANAKVYEKAYRSMLANISSAALTSGSDFTVNSELDSLESAIDALGVSRTSNSIFFQAFQIRATFKMYASYFHN